ncbi:MAG: AgmX/PglI C-terminal domain-containing protein [Deltaproteobacteria bacterium]|nr:MAG: AgmX/PglI C-terminal domain-containing protein [Deltaproteobacteria bacterium]
MTNSTIRLGPLGLKGIVGVMSCAIGLVVVYFGFGVGNESPKREASASVSPAALDQRQKPIRAMNVALGNMVFLAQDLGFSVRNAKNGVTDASKISARIESQLQGIRELYRQEVANNPTLAGGMILQFNVAPSGEISQVQELSSRLNDSDFKRAILAEVSRWSFADIVDDNLTVACPLLFVHEGMDITTLVRWEKFLGNFGDKAAMSRPAANPAPTQQAKATESPATAAGATKTALLTSEKKGPTAGAKEAKEFQIKYPTALRKYPNFTSDSLVTFTTGTKVSVLNKQGDWLEVRSTNGGPTGFIRKEFVVPVEVAHK